MGPSLGSSLGSSTASEDDPEDFELGGSVSEVSLIRGEESCGGDIWDSPSSLEVEARGPMDETSNWRASGATPEFVVRWKREAMSCSNGGSLAANTCDPVLGGSKLRPAPDIEVELDGDNGFGVGTLSLGVAVVVLVWDWEPVTIGESLFGCRSAASPKI